ncbi:MAG: type II secretion system protein GspN [Nitrospira sp.]
MRSSWLKGKKNKAVLVLGYIFFGLLMFLLFLYLSFPFHLLTSKLILVLEEETGCEISVEESRFYFPFRVVWTGIRTRCAHLSFLPEVPGDGRDLTLNITSIDARVAPFLLLLNRRAEIDFGIVLGDGILSGHLTLSQKEKQVSYALSVEGERIDLALFGASGRLDLEGNSDWMNQDLFNGKGVLSFALMEGRFEKIGSWTLPLGALSFSDIHGKMSWGKGRVIVDQFSARGSEVDLQAESGNLILRKPLDGSLVTLTLKAMPKGDLERMATLFIQGYNGRESLILGIRGPLRRPKISLNGRPISP